MHKYDVGLGVTSMCNMYCGFCYSKGKRDNKDIPVNDWVRFFDNNHEYINDINYGTGENTLLEGWYDLVRYINKEYPSIKQALTTNGTLFQIVKNDVGKYKTIIESISEIDVSIDYGDKNAHNTFRGNANAFQNAISTLDFCCKNNIQSTIVIMGYENNLRQANIEKIFDIGRRYNSYVRVNLYRPVNKSCYLKPPHLQTIIDVLDYIDSQELIVSLSDPLFSAIFTESEINRDPSSWSSIRILPNGFIYPSTYLISDSFRVGHISKQNVLKNLAKNEIINEMSNQVLPWECRECEVSARCNGGTIDRRYLWFENMTERDPYCPTRHNKPVRLRSYKVFNKNFSSVHHGYLPTIFFRPK